MSTITAGTGYEGQLWLDHELDVRSFTHEWDSHKVTFGVHGFNVSTKFEMHDEEKLALVQCLAKADPEIPPHWQSLSPDLHRLVESMTDQIFSAAFEADNSLRKLHKGLRLSPLEFRKRRTQAGQIFSVITWQFSDEESNQFKSIFEALGAKAVQAYKSGIEIPMPVHFERRQVHLTEEEIQLVGEDLRQKSEIQPFRRLYAIALDNFVSRSYDPAVLILATSIETGLKWWLINKGDPISDYLLTNIQSPPIDKLYSCARKNTDIELPKRFGEWLVRLRNTRNDIAHKPLANDINPLQIARWFAIGEAIFSAMEGSTIDPEVGSLVEPAGEKAKDKFPPDSRGVVLRREVLYNDNSYHIVLDTGETWRFGEGTFNRCEDQSF